MAAAPDTRPNILLIVADQHRGDAIGIDPLAPACLQTPTLDWLAASGGWFRRAYSECPTCVPARRVLYSGLAPAASGLVGMTRLDFDVPAKLPLALRDAGYQTELVGKSHLFPDHERHGFDHQTKAEATRGNINDCRYTQFLARHGHAYLRPGTGHGALSNSWVGRPSHLPEELSHSFWCVSEAMDFLEHRDRACPFFLNVGLIDPHPPFTPPAWLYERYAAAELPPPAIGDWAEPDRPAARHGIGLESAEVDLPPAARQASAAAYYALVNHIDAQVGRLLQFLKDRKLLANTLILYTSDHGEMLGDHYRAQKQAPFEGSARIPLLLRAPAAWGLAPVATEAPVGLQDVMPTLLEAAGVTPPPHLTGRSLLPLLRGEGTPPRAILHGEHTDQYRTRTAHHYLTDGRAKYIWMADTGRELLFDLVADPRELHDLTPDPAHASALSHFRAHLVDLLRDRPEGFVSEDRLVAGRPYSEIMAGYEPGSVQPFL